MDRLARQLAQRRMRQDLYAQRMYNHFQTANLQPHLWMASAIDNFATIPRADFDALVAARTAEKFTHLRVALDSKTDLNEAAERIRFIHNRGLVTDLVMATLPDDRRERERYITDIVARFAAFNLTWAGVLLRSSNSKMQRRRCEMRAR